MNKEFIPYEQALELKELGFNEPCFMFYEQGTSSKYPQKGIVDDYWGDYSEPRDWNSIPNKPWKPFCLCVSAPLYQQAFRWFREKKMLAEIKAVEDWNTWGFRIFEEDCMSPFYMSYYDYDVNDYNSYEEAEVACLKKLIEIAKNK